MFLTDVYRSQSVQFLPFFPHILSTLFCISSVAHCLKTRIFNHQCNLRSCKAKRKHVCAVVFIRLIIYYLFMYGMRLVALSALAAANCIKVANWWV